MSQTVTIGGNRVGSGKKMKAELHNYFRSTHNLSEDWTSSMGSGILYPCLCKLGLRGDSFDIEMAADARTIPTKGPLFGSFKMQLDVYQCPIRLYQGILHNNPLAIGLKMNQVKFPMLEVMTKHTANDRQSGKFNDSCLLKYLGMSGLGQSANQQIDGTFGRKILALPSLMYYDIFKNYYANKQEDNAYVISVNEEAIAQGTDEYWAHKNTTDQEWEEDPTDESIGITVTQSNSCTVKIPLNDFDWMFNHPEEQITKNKFIYIECDDDVDTNIEWSFNEMKNYFTNGYSDDNIKISFSIGDQDPNNVKDIYLLIAINNEEASRNVSVNIVANEDERTATNKMAITPFKLQNIDDMRYDLLSTNRLGDVFTIKNNEDAYLPYSALVNKLADGTSYNKFPLNGLVLKTYQNDIFNNWLNTEWIEGENGINELTKVEVTDGAFSMDALNFAQKLYNMLNRVAVAGATYEDWQDVVYEEVNRRQIESPIFVGGMSQEIVFDEIVQTAPTGTEGEEDYNALGTLGGRGSVVGETKKGGKIHIKCDEACFIIGIISLTPRQYYTQGNEFYNTEIETMDDLHKPALDGIGFQDLIGERMAWWDTVVTPNSTSVLHRSKIGKLPAWIEYMTSVNKAYGDFAAEGGKGFMILNRNYEMADDGTIKDATTYVDPAKYNYAFAYTDLEAQNFWVKAHFNIKARRLMSARLIPNV